MQKSVRIFLKDCVPINEEIPIQAYHQHNKYIKNIYDSFVYHLSCSQNDGLGDFLKCFLVWQVSDIIQCKKGQPPKSCVGLTENTNDA